MGDAIEVRVPDIGDFEGVEVVEILVSPGDRVEAEDSLVSVESDKATMEIPSPSAGVVQTVHVTLGDRVSEGSLLVELAAIEGAAAGPVTGKEKSPAAPREKTAETVATPPAPASPRPAIDVSSPAPSVADRPQPTVPDRRPGDAEPRGAPVPDAALDRRDDPHASPLVRRQARELGVDLRSAAGTGPEGRVLVEDVKRYVRGALAAGSGSASEDAAPNIDASQFGPVHEQPLGRIRRVSARNLARSWRTAPHVTQHDEADVTELEAFRKSLTADAAERGLKLSPLHFVMKAVAIALADFPDLRSSLGADGEHLIVKDYVHLGIAVDTEHGLVVPVVRDVDKKGLYVLTAELAELAERARTRKLRPIDMQGACFTISSLGGIGGTAFSPIVNTPEVAILGLSKLSVKPIWNAGLDVASQEGRFEPRITMPISLSYDHRVIDGAVGVRFTTRLVRLLSHPAYLLL
jgi:pyruvate dehydrogenase E2 component (dihydrolipoamide acetyltransferase)